MGKVHMLMSRAGKVRKMNRWYNRRQRIEPHEKKKKKQGRAAKRRQFHNYQVRCHKEAKKSKLINEEVALSVRKFERSPKYAKREAEGYMYCGDGKCYPYVVYDEVFEIGFDELEVMLLYENELRRAEGTLLSYDSILEDYELYPKKGDDALVAMDIDIRVSVLEHFGYKPEVDHSLDAYEVAYVKQVFYINILGVQGI